MIGSDCVRKGSHTQYDIQYHIVWITKYRYKILNGKIAYRLRELIRQGCEARNIQIIKGSISRDHVHMLVSCPPNISVAQMMQYLKGRSSKKLEEEFLILRESIVYNIYEMLDIFVEPLVQLLMKL